MIAMLARALLHGRRTRTVRLALGMAAAGTALVIAGPRGLGELAGRFGLGALLALGAGLSYAVDAVTAKRLLAHRGPLIFSLEPGPTAGAHALFGAGLRRAAETAAGIVSRLDPLTAATRRVAGSTSGRGVAGAAGALVLRLARALLALAGPPAGPARAAGLRASGRSPATPPG